MISLFTRAMPADEAANLMRIVLQSFGQSTDDVERWEAEVAQRKHTYNGFKQLSTSTGWEHYPIIIFRIKDSQNPTYEWEGEIMVRWTAARYPDGWDEAKAALNNPKPPTGFERISLNPPSGRFYSQREGIEIATGVTLPPLEGTSEAANEVRTPEEEIHAGAIATASHEEPTEPGTNKPPTESTMQSFNGLQWLLLALILVGLALLPFGKNPQK